MLERHKGNAYYEERAWADWVAYLCYQNKLDKANEMVEKALEKFPQSASLYNKKGLLLSIRGDMVGTLAADKKAMDLIAPGRQP